jgi:hypothetical protein
MGSKQSTPRPGWDWDVADLKKVIVVRGVRGSGRSWLCDALGQLGCDCIDVKKFASDGYDPELSRSENVHNARTRFKDLMVQSHSGAVVLISDDLIQSRRPTAKFFIELQGEALPFAYRRGQAMMLDRVTRHEQEIRAALRSWPVANLASVFPHFGFDFRHHDDFSKFVDSYQRAAAESLVNGYRVLPIGDIKQAIATMCR